MTRTRSAAPRFYGPRLLVRDFRAVWTFYKEVIGLAPVAGHGEPPYGEFLLEGGGVLGLFEQDQMAVATGLRTGRVSRRTLGGTGLVFEVDDVDAVAARLRGRKIKLLRGPTDRPAWGLRTLHLQDPEGRLIEVESRRE